MSSARLSRAPRSALAAAVLALLLCGVAAGPAAAALGGTDVLDDVGSIAAAGDVNGDGIDDIATGDRVRFGVRDGAPAATDPGFDVVGSPGPGQSVSGLTAAGDVDGDGFDDVLFESGGTTFVVYGAAGTTAVDVSSARVTRIPGGEAQPAFDLDGDGRDELIVRAGAPGQAWAIVHGGARVAEIPVGATGPRVTFVPLVRDCDPMYSSGSFFGWRYRFLTGTRCTDAIPAIQAPGDVNGDGRGDLFFPDNPDQESNDFARGYGEIWQGRAPIPATLDTRSLGTTGVARVNVPAPIFGWAVANPAVAPPIPAPIGDVTGDGLADLVVRPQTLGAFWILPGRSGTAPYEATEAARITVTAPAPPDATFPDVVYPVPVGDVDGDGVKDIGVFGPSSATTIRLTVKAGSRTPGGTAPTIVDGLPGVDGVMPFTAPWPAQAPAAAPLGDVDGDGRDDLAVSAESCFGVPAILATWHPDRAAPRLRRFCEGGTAQRLSPTAVLPGATQTWSVTLLDPATVRFEVRRDGGLVTAEERQLPAGSSTVTWSAAAAGQPLAPGRYVLRIIPRDGAGNVGAAEDLPFDVGEPAPKPTALSAARIATLALDDLRIELKHCEPDARRVVSASVPAGWTQVSGPTAPFTMTPSPSTGCATEVLTFRRGASAVAGDAVFTPEAGAAARVALSAQRDGVTLEQVAATADRVTIRVTNTGPLFRVAGFQLPAGWIVAERIGFVGSDGIPYGESQLVLVRGTTDGELVFTYPAGATGWQPPARIALTGATPDEARFTLSPGSAQISAVYGRAGRGTFTVTNIGSSAGPVALLGLTVASGRVYLESTTCRAGGAPDGAPVPIPAGGTCTATVVFRPEWGDRYGPTTLFADTAQAVISFRAKYW